jgi:hypothetical protein
MIYIPTYFGLEELACDHVYNKYGEFAWNFFDTRLLIMGDTIRDKIGKAIYANDWYIHGKLSQRGLRCPFCQIVKDKVANGELYMSAHCLGKGFDFTIEGMLAEETRRWLISKQSLWPYPFRLEDGVDWIHLDLYHDGREQKVYLFNAA